MDVSSEQSDVNIAVEDQPATQGLSGGVMFQVGDEVEAYERHTYRWMPAIVRQVKVKQLSAETWYGVSWRHKNGTYSKNVYQAMASVRPVSTGAARPE
jgi:hypothetical protein